MNLRPMTPPAASAVVVLLTPELLCVIAYFQDGLHEDILPFRASTFDVDAIVEIDTVLRPWLACHGHARLDRLVALDYFVSNMLLAYGAYFGNVDLLVALEAHIPKFKLGRHFLPVLKYAAIGGSLPTFEYLERLGYTHSMPTALQLAASSGHVALVAAKVPAVVQTPKLARELLVRATEHDRADVVELFLSKSPPDAIDQAFLVAVCRAAVASIRLLQAAGGTLTKVNALFGPAKNGRADVVRLMLETGVGYTTGWTRVRDVSFSGAVAGGHVDLAKWIVARSGPAAVVVDPRHVTDALTGEHAAIFDFLWTLPWKPSATAAWTTEFTKRLTYAATKGHLQMVQCLLAKQPMGDAQHLEAVLDDAARARQINLVRWCFESGKVAATPSRLVRTMAAATAQSFGHKKSETMAILAYVISLFPTTYTLPNAIVLASANKDDDHVFFIFWQWWRRSHDSHAALSLGHECLVAAIARDYVYIAKRLVDTEGIPVTEAMVHQAASTCQPEGRLMDWITTCNVQSENQKTEEEAHATPTSPAKRPCRGFVGNTCVTFVT
ncbi:Aste57867_1979 [Aphanomyces stellatus]|uniref:Aste57867_1979 protein n=1 Tax=Aphanomyces stellatus TaxID=120398 RepID=A0A485K7Q4_9STRA|nr:hypothetical protein As57867_001977 [Aphanomyces stellatus]VFT79184.1 Aste57867_1979 [Aphanomyces stellatus]